MPTIVNPLDLNELSLVHGIKHQKLEHQNQMPGSALEGQIVLTKTLSNLLIHLSDQCELQDINVACERAQEMSLGVLLEGKLQFSLGQKVISLEVLPGGRPICFLFNMLFPIRWERRLIKNNHVRKAVITLPHTWLKARFSGTSQMSQFVQQLIIQHALVLTGKADHPLHRITQGLLNSSKANASEIELEGQALTLVVEILKTVHCSKDFIQKQTPGSNAQSPITLRICQYIEQFLAESHPQTNIDLRQLVKDLGLSVSTAQRQFKQDFKVTIMEYIRTQRLNRARDELLRGLSIGEVAYTAGYTHTSNFSLAFKKYFGVSPGDLVKRKCSQ